MSVQASARSVTAGILRLRFRWESGTAPSKESAALLLKGCAVGKDVLRERELVLDTSTGAGMMAAAGARVVRIVDA